MKIPVIPKDVIDGLDGETSKQVIRDEATRITSEQPDLMAFIDRLPFTSPQKVVFLSGMHLLYRCLEEMPEE